MSFFSYTASSDKAQDQQAKFDEVRKNIEALKAELEKTKSSRNDLQKTLESNEKNILELNQQTDKLKKKLDHSQQKLDELNNEKTDLTKKKSHQQQLVSDYINAAYRLGQQSQLRMLLNQQDPAQIARMVKYYQAFSDRRSHKVTEFVATIQRLETIETTIAAEQDTLASNYQKLKQKKQTLNITQQARKKTLASLNSDVNQQSRKLKALEQDRRRLEKVLSRVIAVMDAQELNPQISDFSKLRGKLPWPTRGTVRHHFGSKRSGHFTWQGIKMDAPRGHPVKAVHHGQVIFSDYLRGQGLLIIIDHGRGYMTLYAHNDNLYKDIGEWVEPGETIGSVGNTGGLIKAALYFELRYQGKPTNPTKWLRPA